MTSSERPKGRHSFVPVAAFASAVAFSLRHCTIADCRAPASKASSGIRFPSSTATLQKDVTPLNPDWCKSIKDLKASFGVLYTEYLPMTWDWGYNATVGQTMSTSNFKSVWAGTFGSSYNNSTRLAYIPTALAACASNKSLFLQANSSAEIEAGLSSLFQQYVAKVRLTN